MLKTERFDYANMTSLMTPRLFSTVNGEFLISCLKWIFKFRKQNAFQINFLPFPLAHIERYTEMA